MYAQVEKPKESKGKLAIPVAQKQNSNAHISSFVDNRTPATQMCRLQELAKNSPQVAQLRTLQKLVDAHSVTQKKNNVKHSVNFLDNRPASNAQMKMETKSCENSTLNNCLLSTRNLIQMVVKETRKGKAGYWDAKKIQSNNMGTKWWQFKGGWMAPIKGEFQNNELGTGTYYGTKIPTSDYGTNAVIASTNVESPTSGYMEMASGELRSLSTVSDSAIFDAATRLTGQKWKGMGNTWHHGATIGEMFLLDSEIHGAFAPHVGWASQGGSRNEMRDFIVGDDVFD